MAGYIGKSLATGGTAVDAYSKTQTDEKYLKLAGGLMTGGVRQGVLSVSADTTITASHPNVVLVTTGTDSITLTLPSAGDVGGQVYRFMKVDTGTGKVILARAGSDTMGINANLTMELWFQDNYVDIMSDGTSRWIVMSTEMFIIPDDRRTDTNLPAGLSSTSFAPVDYSAIVPAGTRVVKIFCFIQNDASGEAVLMVRRTGSTETLDARLRSANTRTLDSEQAAYGERETSIFDVEVNIDREFDYKVDSSDASVWMVPRGYRLG
jgi:hypothetical protein